MNQQRQMLIKCRDQFSFYADNHEAKVGKFYDEILELNPVSDSGEDYEKQQVLCQKYTDTLQKAAHNREMVNQIDALLNQPDEVGGIEGIVAFAQVAYADGVTDRNRQTQLGVHFEEQAELLETISGRDVMTCEILGNAESALKLLSEHFKNTSTLVYAINDRLGFLDALCDQAVTGTLTAVLHNFDITSGLQEVNRSNASKLVNGVMEKDPTTFKWIKGPNYSAPNLKPFI